LYLLAVPAKPSQTVYRLNMKESLQRPDPLNGRNIPARPASSRLTRADATAGR
jgi:hypothetical protein